jgi:hypothetical protein
MVTLKNNNAFTIAQWPAAASADATKGDIDELALEFKRHLLSAAAWIGEESLVAKLLGEDCNWFDG